MNIIKHLSAFFLTILLISSTATVFAEEITSDQIMNNSTLANAHNPKVAYLDTVTEWRDTSTSFTTTYEDDIVSITAEPKGTSFQLNDSPKEGNYFIGNGYNFLGVSGTTLSLEDIENAAMFTFKKSGSGFTIKKGNYYLSSTGSNSSRTLQLSTTSTVWYCNHRGLYHDVNGTFWYLQSNNASSLSSGTALLFEGQFTYKRLFPAGTSIQVTGKKIGDTIITLGEKEYGIKVIPQQNDPITLIMTEEPTATVYIPATQYYEPSAMVSLSNTTVSETHSTIGLGQHRYNYVITTINNGNKCYISGSSSSSPTGMHFLGLEGSGSSPKFKVYEDAADALQWTAVSAGNSTYKFYTTWNGSTVWLSLKYSTTLSPTTNSNNATAFKYYSGMLTTSDGSYFYYKDTTNIWSTYAYSGSGPVYIAPKTSIRHDLYLTEVKLTANRAGTAVLTVGGTETTDITVEAKHHTYEKPEFHWTEDPSNCKAVFTCINNNCTKDSTSVVETTAEITSSTTSPTCTENGCITYTAAVANPRNSSLIYTEEQKVTLPATGHSYKISYEWAEDHSDCKTIFFCSICQNQVNVSAEVSVTKTMDEKAAYYTYTAALKHPETQENLTNTVNHTELFRYTDHGAMLYSGETKTITLKQYLPETVSPPDEDILSISADVSAHAIAPFNGGNGIFRIGDGTHWIKAGTDRLYVTDNPNLATDFSFISYGTSFRIYAGNKVLVYNSSYIANGHESASVWLDDLDTESFSYWHWSEERGLYVEINVTSNITGATKRYTQYLSFAKMYDSEEFYVHTTQETPTSKTIPYEYTPPETKLTLQAHDSGTTTFQQGTEYFAVQVIEKLNPVVTLSTDGTDGLPFRDYRTIIGEHVVELPENRPAKVICSPSAFIGANYSVHSEPAKDNHYCFIHYNGHFLSLASDGSLTDEMDPLYATHWLLLETDGGYTITAKDEEDNVYALYAIINESTSTATLTASKTDASIFEGYLTPSISDSSSEKWYLSTNTENNWYLSTDENAANYVTTELSFDHAEWKTMIVFDANQAGEDVVTIGDTTFQVAVKGAKANVQWGEDSPFVDLKGDFGPVRAIVAEYDSNGKFLGATETSLYYGKGIYILSRPAIEGAITAKVFVVNADYEPLYRAEAHSLVS